MQHDVDGLPLVPASVQTLANAQELLEQLRGSNSELAAALEQRLQEAMAAVSPTVYSKPGPHPPDRTAALTWAAIASMAQRPGGMPPALLRLVAPIRAHLDVVGPLGQGGFGSVVLALNTLDQRLTAVKQVRFTSSVPPWAQPQQLEAGHQRLLREVQALAALGHHPNVTDYYTAWIEPDWQRIGQYMQGGGPRRSSSGSGAAGGRPGRRPSHSKPNPQQQQQGGAQGGGAAAAGPGNLGVPAVVVTSPPKPPLAAAAAGGGAGGVAAAGTVHSSHPAPHLQQHCVVVELPESSSSEPSRSSGAGSSSRGDTAGAGSTLGSDTMNDVTASDPGATQSLYWSPHEDAAVTFASTDSGGSGSQGAGHGAGAAGKAAGYSTQIEDTDVTHTGWTEDTGSSGSSGDEGSSSDDDDESQHIRQHVLLSGTPASQHVKLHQQQQGGHGSPAAAAAGAGGGAQQSTSWALTPADGRRGSGVGAGGLLLPTKWPYVLLISMEYVPGITLDGFLRQVAAAGSAAPPPGDLERSLLVQLLLGLHHIHSRGYIHRDLKPANVFLSPLQPQQQQKAQQGAGRPQQQWQNGVQQPQQQQQQQQRGWAGGGLGQPPAAAGGGGGGIGGAGDAGVKPHAPACIIETISTRTGSSSEQQQVVAPAANPTASAAVQQPPQVVGGAAVVTPGQVTPVTPVTHTGSTIQINIPGPGAAPAPAAAAATAAAGVGPGTGGPAAAGSWLLSAWGSGNFVVKIGDFGLAVPASGQASSRDSSTGGAATAAAAVGAPGDATHQSATPHTSSSTSSMDTTPDDVHTAGVGTPTYIAPEQLQPQQLPPKALQQWLAARGGKKGRAGRYTQAVDMYALGLIVLELFSRFQTGMERAVALYSARSGRLPAAFTKHYPTEALLVEKLLSINPDARPTAAQLLQHPLLQPYLWSLATSGNDAAVAAAAAAAAASWQQQHPGGSADMAMGAGASAVGVATAAAAAAGGSAGLPDWPMRSPSPSAPAVAAAAAGVMPREALPSAARPPVQVEVLSSTEGDSSAGGAGAGLQCGGALVHGNTPPAARGRVSEPPSSIHADTTTSCSSAGASCGVSQMPGAGKDTPSAVGAACTAAAAAADGGSGPQDMSLGSTNHRAAAGSQAACAAAGLCGSNSGQVPSASPMSTDHLGQHNQQQQAQLGGSSGDTVVYRGGVYDVHQLLQVLLQRDAQLAAMGAVALQ